MMRGVVFGLVLLAACGSDPPPQPMMLLPPDGVTCGARTIEVSGATELRAALLTATDGDCILADSGDYPGPFEAAVAGVTIAGARGASVNLSGGTTVLRVSAARVKVAALRISNGMRHGIFADAPSLVLDRVTVVDTGDIAVAIKCEDQGCLDEVGHLELTGVTVERARTGIYVGHARAEITGTTVSGVTTQGIGGGAGLFALDGAYLQISASTFEQNIYGLVIDGATTHAVLEDLIVSDNEDVGVWAQGLRGTMASPALEIRGASTRITRNSITGAGATNSTGISITGGEITQTIKKVVQIDLGQSAEIGDGVGLFDSTGDVLVQGVSLLGNQRTQAVVDGVGLGIRFDAANDVQAMQDEYKVVVQNTIALVVVPAEDLSVAPLLPVRDSNLAAPGAP